MESCLKIKFRFLFSALAFFAGAELAAAQGTAFTYQGQLQNNGAPANGSFDLTFCFFNANTMGTLVAGPVTNSLVPVTNGLFTVTIDFGAEVTTNLSNWLQIGVRTNGASTFSTLTPRQQITAVPYAIYAETANAATLTGIIPTASVSGSYGNPVTFTNSNNNFAGSGAGLSNLASANLNGVVSVPNGGTGSSSGRAAGASVGILQMSPVGGGLAFSDMLAASAAFEGQIGVSYYGSKAPFIFEAASTGTNHWMDVPWFFPAGIANIGNYYWPDANIPLQTGNMILYRMYGSNASSFQAALPNGPDGQLMQSQGMGVVCGNPYAGTAQVFVKVATTNPAVGNYGGGFIGTTAEGENLYLDQYGFSIYQNSFEYVIGEANIAGTQGFLANDTRFDTCISYNGERPGDSSPKQFSTFTIRATNTASIIGGFPYQVANVEWVQNPLWKWALMVNENTGDVYATNGTLNTSNLSVAGSAIFDRPPTFGVTNSGPTNSTSPRIWVPFTNGGSVFYLPGYQ